MKKYILILIITISQLFAISANIESSFATGIFHENGTGEKIQHKRVTDEDYQGTCYSKIAVLGKIQHKNIQVKIGDSLGYFEVKIDGKIYDYKVFVK